jgi:hypothetical protein
MSSIRSVLESLIEAVEGGSGVYSIHTLRLLFHIGKLLCVTCHFSVIHCIVGEWYSVGASADEKVGGRTMMVSAMLRDKASKALP